jgi:hypothetical protein
MSERTPDGDLSRRSLLRGMGGLGATGLVGSLVGCSQVTDRRYEAAPVALEDADEREQRLFDAGTWEVTKRPEALGLDVEATLVNHFAAYRGPERIESRDVEFFGKETTAKAFAGAPGEDTFVVFEVARVIHEGDVVFGVRSTSQDAEGRPMQPLSNHNIDWEQVEEDLENATRPDSIPDPVDMCDGLRYVAITKPKNNGNTWTASPDTKVGGQPAIEITAHARTKVNHALAAEFNCPTPDKSFCHYEWSYREEGSGATWKQAGTGQIATFALPEKRSICNPTTYRIRVKAFDSDGNHESTDKITYTISVSGC